MIITLSFFLFKINVFFNELTKVFNFHGHNTSSHLSITERNFYLYRQKHNENGTKLELAIRKYKKMVCESSLSNH